MFVVNSWPTSFSNFHGWTGSHGTMEALRFSAVLWTFTARQRRVVWPFRKRVYCLRLMGYQMISWLVVSNPLKDISRLGCLVPIYGNMFQTTNQYQMVHIPGLINDFISGDIMEYLILDIMVIASCYFTMRLSVHIVPSSRNCGADGELVAWTNRMPLIILMLKVEYDIQVDINSATKKLFRSGNLGKSKHWLCNLTCIFLWYNWYNHWLQMLQSFRPRCHM